MKMMFRLTALVMVFLITACNPTETPVDPLDDAYRTLTIASELTDEPLPTSDGEVVISWSANVEGVLNNNQIIQGEYDIDVTLTALLEFDDRSLSKVFHVTILGVNSGSTPSEIVVHALQELSLSDVLEPGLLPTQIGEVTISWESSSVELLDGNELLQPPVDEEITLTATLTYLDQTRTKEFTVLVVGELSYAEAALIDFEIEIKMLLQFAPLFGEDLDFPLSYQGVSITYQSSHPQYISNDGVVTHPDIGEEDVDVTITVIMEFDGAYRTFTVEYTVEAEQELLYIGYYLGADDLQGDALRDFLHDLIDDHTVYSYSALWDALSYTDEDPNNPDNVIMLYSGISKDEDEHGGDSNDWNREHVWPRSHGDLDDTGNPANTDMHHVRPTLVPVNSARGNLDFDEGGTLVSGTTDSYKDGDSFEPRDDVKGDVARMIFYMAIRYEGDEANEVDLELNDLVNNSGPFMGRLTILIQWHLEDPPDEFEQTRNDRIYELQGNRNPFIDHPEFVEYIWDIS